MTRLFCVLALLAALILPATSFAGDDDAPSAGPVSVSEVGSVSARVAATVTLGKGSAAYWFEYAAAPAPDKQTPAGTATHEEDDKQHRVQVSRTLTGLTPGTAYVVRLVAAGSGGRGVGAPTAFTTAPAASGDDPADPADPDAPAPPVAPADPAPQPPHDPALGASFVAVAEQGHVRVRLPGVDRFVELPQAASLPVGTIVDARAGTIALSTALPGGDEQHGIFWGARFKVRQSADGDGRTDLHLRGGGFAACRHRGTRAVAAVAAAGGRKPVRRLWGKDDGGRFRTHGRDSVATVRGTAWSVTDRCDGTVTKVTEGAVDVKNRHTGRVTRVRAGERLLAPRPR